MWLWWLFFDIGVPQSTSSSIHCDNESALQISHNDVSHEHAKHIEIDCHFIRHHLQHGILHLHFVSFVDQLADIFTKSHLPGWLNDFIFKLKLALPHRVWGDVRILYSNNDCHFLWHHLQHGILHLHFVSFVDQLAIIFTKSHLPRWLNDIIFKLKLASTHRVWGDVRILYFHNIYMTKYSHNILNILQKYSPHIMAIFSTVFIIVNILILCDVVSIVFPFL